MALIPTLWTLLLTFSLATVIQLTIHDGWAVNAVLALLAMNACSFSWNVYRWSLVTLSSLPGPSSPSFVFGHIAQMSLAKVGELQVEWGKRFGHVYRIRGSCNEPVLVLTDPKAVAYVMNTRAANFPRSDIDLTIMRLAFGKEGILVAEGEAHRRLRKPFNSAYSILGVKKISNEIYELAQKLCESWKEELNAKPNREARFDMSDRMKNFTFVSQLNEEPTHPDLRDRPIPELLRKVGSLEESKLTILLLLIFTKMPFLLSIPNALSKQWETLRYELGKVAKDVWLKSSQEPGSRTKVLDMLIDGSLSRDEAIAQISGILFAGSETTANLISECLHELCRRQDVQAKLRRELVDYLGNNNGVIDHDDLVNPVVLPYLDASMRETFRLKASVPDLCRESFKEDVIPLEYPITLSGKVTDKIPVEAGQRVVIPVRDGINVCETIWGEDGREFRPERWLSVTQGGNGIASEIKKIKAPNHILTFGDGPKICAGRIFAATEFKIIISTLLQNFEFFPPEDPLELNVDYYVMGPTVKPKIRGREGEGIQLPIRVKVL